MIIVAQKHQDLCYKSKNNLLIRHRNIMEVKHLQRR